MSRPSEPLEITRDWLLSELPLRKVEKQIVRDLKASGFSAVLRHVMRRDLMPTGEVGVVDVDVELGKFFTHAMDGGALYVEAIYAGTADVDVKLRDDSGLPFAGARSRSFMLNIEVTAQIDVVEGKLAGFELSDVEIF